MRQSVKDTIFIEAFNLMFIYIDDTLSISQSKRGRRGRDRMVVGFTMNYATSAYYH